MKINQNGAAPRAYTPHEQVKADRAVRLVKGVYDLLDTVERNNDGPNDKKPFDPQAYSYPLHPASRGSSGGVGMEAELDKNGFTTSMTAETGPGTVYRYDRTASGEEFMAVPLNGEPVIVTLNPEGTITSFDVPDSDEFYGYLLDQYGLERPDPKPIEPTSFRSKRTS